MNRPSSALSTNTGNDLDFDATANPPIDDVLTPLVDLAPLGLVDSTAPDTTLGGTVVNPSSTDSNTPHIQSSVDHTAAIPIRQSDRKAHSAGGRTSSDRKVSTARGSASADGNLQHLSSADHRQTLQAAADRRRRDIDYLEEEAEILRRTQALKIRRARDEIEDLDRRVDCLTVDAELSSPVDELLLNKADDCSSVSDDRDRSGLPHGINRSVIQQGTHRRHHHNSGLLPSRHRHHHDLHH